MIHPTADISGNVKIGKNTRIWHHVQVREDAVIGDNCIVGKGAYIDKGVKIGNNVKIQNYASIYHGSTIEDGVFIGPNAVLANDKSPRAVNPDGSLQKEEDWETGKILVREGASIGTGAVVLPDVTIGEFAMVGAGSIVTKSVPGYALVFGNPAKIKGSVCKCGKKSATKECERCK